MVFLARLFGVAALAAAVTAAPMPGYSSDSSSESNSGNSYNSGSSGYSNSNENNNNNYGGSNNNNNNYGSSSNNNNNYGNNNNNYGNNNYDSSSTTTIFNNHGSNNYGGNNNYYTTTSSAMSSYNTPSYGSGQWNWNSDEYNSCINQCINDEAPPMAKYGESSSEGNNNGGSEGSSSEGSSSEGSSSENSESPSTTSSSNAEGAGATGGIAGSNGVTHTVHVAPTQGVLRYVPFATNASVGDTIQFVWGANNHTVTKSSEVEMCNKNANAPFASGTNNQGFTFNQVVNDTNPIYFYCGTPTHCQKGMFGMINPPSAFNAPTSVSSLMPNMVTGNGTISAMMGYVNNLAAVNNDTRSANWGSNMDLSAMSSDDQLAVVSNVLYTRAMLLANPGMLQADGSFNMSAGFNIPSDIPSALASVGGPITNAAATNASSSSAAPSSTASGKTNSGAGFTTPSMFVAALAVVATVFAL